MRRPRSMVRTPFVHLFIICDRLQEKGLFVAKIYYTLWAAKALKSTHIEFSTKTVDTTLIPYLSSHARARSIPFTRKPLRAFKGHVAGRVQTPLVHG